MCNLQNWSFLLGIQNECFKNESPQVEIFLKSTYRRGMHDVKQPLHNVSHYWIVSRWTFNFAVLWWIPSSNHILKKIIHFNCLLFSSNFGWRSSRNQMLLPCTHWNQTHPARVCAHLLTALQLLVPVSRCHQQELRLSHKEADQLWTGYTTRASTSLAITYKS